jgi:hypothetical protein
MMEQFLDSLTEEQAELLGLSEAFWNDPKSQFNRITAPAISRLGTGISNIFATSRYGRPPPASTTPAAAAPTSSMAPPAGGAETGRTTVTSTAATAPPSGGGEIQTGPASKTLSQAMQDAGVKPFRSSAATVDSMSPQNQLTDRGERASTGSSGFDLNKLSGATGTPATPAAPSRTGGGSGGSSRPSSASSSSGSSSGYTERSGQGRDWKEKAFSPDTGG